MYNFFLLEPAYRRLTKKLFPVIKSLNSDQTQSILEKRKNFEGGLLCPEQFFFRRVIKPVKFEFLDTDT